MDLYKKETKMKVRYSTYSTTDGTGKIWTFDHQTKVLFDPYNDKVAIKKASSLLLANVLSGIFKHIWSTDKTGKYI